MPSAPLTPITLHILLALSQKERHGYDIMKHAEEDSNGAVRLGPGTLYSSIKRLLHDRLIEEADIRPDAEMDDERRRYYRLTAQGKSVLSTELERLDAVCAIGRGLDLLPHSSFAA